MRCLLVGASLFVASAAAAACASSQRAAVDAAVDAPRSDVSWSSACDAAVARAASSRAPASGDEPARPQPGRSDVDTATAGTLVTCSRALRAQAARAPLLWIVVAGPLSETLPAGLHIGAPHIVRLAMTRGRTVSMPDSVAMNAIALLDVDDAGARFDREVRAPVVFADPRAAIDVLLASPDGRHIAIVQHLGAAYQGANVPHYLMEAWVTVIDVDTLLPRVVDVAFDEAQSIVVAWSDDALHILARDVWNGGDDGAAVGKRWQCTRDGASCTPLAPVDPQAIPFPTRARYAEATASGGYVVTPQDAIAAPPIDGVDRRSIRASPSRKRTAWVHEEVEDAKLGLLQRTLSVRGDHAGSHPGNHVAHDVARGSSKLHALWIDDDHLLYDGEPVMSDVWRATYQAPPAATAQEVDADVGEVGEPALRDLLVRARMNEANALRTWLAENDALIALQGVDVASLQHEQLFVFDVRTKTSTPLVLAGQRHARLFAQPRRANLRGDDLNVEVPPLR